MSDLKPIYEGVDFCRARTEKLWREEVLPFLGRHLHVEMTGDTKVRADVTGFLDAPIPTSWARDIGMLMNELRVQLDHLANVLGRRNGANADDSSFPLLDDAANLNATARKKVRLLKPADQNLIWLMQPYQDPKTEPLLRLHAGDIIRKHRKPLGVEVTVSPMPTAPGRVGSLAFAEPFITEPAKLVHVAYIEEAEMPFDLGATIAVRDPPALWGMRTFEVLEAGAEAVVYVTDKFA